MSFSQEWDQAYRDHLQWSVWPWSDLVSLVHRYTKPSDGFRRVLELGCGAGANIPFFTKLGVDYSAIEGSPFIVAELHKSFPELRENIVVGDFTKAIPLKGQFDLVVDRGSLTHNTTAAIQRTLVMIFKLIRPGGRFIGIHWYSTKHSDVTRGEQLDSHTRTNISAGQFSRIGAVHFSDQAHLIDLLHDSGFRLERLDHSQVDNAIPAGEGRLGWWNFVAARP